MNISVDNAQICMRKPSEIKMDIINFQINDNLSEKKTKKEININKKEKRKLKN
jgi:hypothetical protein